MAVIFFALAGALPAAAAPSGELHVSSAPEADVGIDVPRPSHRLAIEVVEPGREGLELTARLTEDGGTIERNLSWTIRSAEGETVFSGEAGMADASVPPGDYAVQLRYGAARLSSTVSLLPANRVKVSFVLNAGALRILPRVSDMGLPPSGARVRVFSLGGREDGRLVAVSATPGEIIRVPEGQYRVESRFAAGNARAVTDVRVTAGRMSAVDIDHKAGIARLAFVGSPAAQVSWQVKDSRGAPVARLTGLNADLVLVPGTYTASAEVDKETLTATFEIGAGDERDILLGN
ncbi:hypothetical protein [Aestuariivirga sp.]|uniref:hypothetical protein n=1 Tax=Aestuariivirga sp. TaxID=2650926 RepID=UPI0039189D21